MADLGVAGGKNAIYVISAEGRHGTLRIPTSTYQSYSARSLKVL
jgi:hypothetical protein